MQYFQPAFDLGSDQSSMIHASTGFRLDVLSGCLWLTRPGDRVDRFLVAGSSIELHEDDVLVQCVSQAGVLKSASARYVLVGLDAPTPIRKRLDVPYRFSELVRTRMFGLSS